MRIFLAFAFFCTGVVQSLAVEYKNAAWMTGALFGVGQSLVIHSVRADGCGGAPPSWAKVKARLPASRLGVFSDGGMGWRWSGSCDAFVPGRAIVFTAKRKGIELFSILPTATGTIPDETHIEVR